MVHMVHKPGAARAAAVRYGVRHRADAARPHSRANSFYGFHEKKEEEGRHGIEQRIQRG